MRKGKKNPKNNQLFYKKILTVIETSIYSHNNTYEKIYDIIFDGLIHHKYSYMGIFAASDVRSTSKWRETRTDRTIAQLPKWAIPKYLPYPKSDRVSHLLQHVARFFLHQA